MQFTAAHAPPQPSASKGQLPDMPEIGPKVQQNMSSLHWRHSACMFYVSGFSFSLHDRSRECALALLFRR
jgi:hypothetical protein